MRSKVRISEYARGTGPLSVTQRTLWVGNRALWWRERILASSFNGLLQVKAVTAQAGLCLRQRKRTCDCVMTFTEADEGRRYDGAYIISDHDIH